MRVCVFYESNILFTLFIKVTRSPKKPHFTFFEQKENMSSFSFAKKLPIVSLVVLKNYDLVRQDVNFKTTIR